MGAETMKIVSAFFTKQRPEIAEGPFTAKQAIPHLGAKLKGFTKSEGGVTRAISPPHFSQITPRCELTCCCAAFRSHLVRAKNAAALFISHRLSCFVVAACVPSLDLAPQRRQPLRFGILG
jgi:hypothetical protein